MLSETEVFRGPWLRRCGGAPRPTLRLICLPYAGAGASMFGEWRLPGDLEAEIWAVQPPGREQRWSEPPIRRADLLAEHIAQAVRPLLDVPCAVFGHSMGALLAFEVCRRLRRSGGPQPVRLIVSGHRAPHLPPWRPEASTLTDEGLLARLDEMAGPSVTVLRDRALLLAMAPLIRADLEVCERYVYLDEPPLDLPLTCLAATDDPEVRLDEMVAWRHHTTRECGVRPFTGGHLFLRDRIGAVLEHVAEDLAA
ncbi:thioesterase II family protein [Nonomuraea purpurea]|uniref:Thioesterase II family protein n=1 Tax=Nonomuraea purpurea TaxID=1849276 RepID=A0ABV8GP78_9ACTN